MTNRHDYLEVQMLDFPPVVFLQLFDQTGGRADTATPTGPSQPIRVGLERRPLIGAERHFTSVSCPQWEKLLQRECDGADPPMGQ